MLRKVTLTKTREIKVRMKTAEKKTKMKNQGLEEEMEDKLKKKKN